MSKRGKSDPGRGKRRSPRMLLELPGGVWGNTRRLRRGWGLAGQVRGGGQKPGADRDGPRRVVSGLCCASPRYLFSLLNPPIVFSCGHSPIERNWKGKMLIRVLVSYIPFI